MNKILLITTKGCEGCKIMYNNIIKALADCDKSIAFELKDVEDLSKAFLNKHNITDFPCTMLYKDDELKFIKVGSSPIAAINTWINLSF